MAYKYFSRNGKLLPASEAVVPLDNIAYAYGFGVYETIRVLKNKALFLEEHCRRLMASARIIGLDHTFSKAIVEKSAKELIAGNDAVNCNLKVLLIGSKSRDDAVLNILCLNPLFPDRKLYSQGVHTITKNIERLFPHAKTLNMLPSYLAYRDAKAAGAHDALLVNRRGCIIEGTSTNFFALKNRTIFSPPESDILLGVTRQNVLKVAGDNGFSVKEREIKPQDVGQYDNLFLTGTSIKILPIRSIDETVLESPGSDLRELMRLFDGFLAGLESSVS